MKKVLRELFMNQFNDFREYNPQGQIVQVRPISEPIEYNFRDGETERKRNARLRARTAVPKLEHADSYVKGEARQLQITLTTGETHCRPIQFYKIHQSLP